jgi:hypothetical protein
VETDPTRMCELLVGLPDVRILGVHGRAGDVLRIYIESRGERPGCSHCGVLAQLKDRSAVELVDLCRRSRYPAAQRSTNPSPGPWDCVYSMAAPGARRDGLRSSAI